MQLKPQDPNVPGKTVGNKRYLHVDALPESADGPEAEALLAAVARAETLAGVRRGEHFNAEIPRLLVVVVLVVVAVM